MRPLNTDPVRGYLVALGAATGGPYHCYGNPTMDISVCPGIGLPPLGDEADVQAFQSGLHLGY